MKTLYIDCGMGAAGDMLTAALLELVDDKQAFVDKINSLGLDGVRVSCDKVSKCGIMANSVNVTVNGAEEVSHDVHSHKHIHSNDEHNHEDAHSSHSHGSEAARSDVEDQHHEHEHASEAHHHEHEHTHHRHLSDIEAIIDGLDIKANVKSDAKAIYKIIAEAESKAHGVEVSEIHFHEVGMMDAIVDVLSVALLMDEIGPDKVIASPIHVGSGKVKCAHGIVPVPAPATARILEGVPIYSTEIKGELCTPTGAAIIKYYADKFGNIPLGIIRKQGYGAGKKDFDAANVIRVLLFDEANATDSIVKLECNVDDMTGEEVGYAIEKLMSLGARDVYVTSVMGKKGRPGFLISVITDNEKETTFVEGIFKYTTTIGIRKTLCDRYVLKRRIEECDIDGETVHKKISEGYGVTREKYEYEDIKQIADKKDMSLRDVVNRK